MQRYVRFVLPIAWMALIFALSHRPVLELQGDLQTYDYGARKIAHMVEYAILFGLWIYALVPHVSLKQTLWSSFLIAFVYAISDEYHQSLVTNRSGKSSDVLIDMVGVSGAILLLKYWYAYHNKKSLRVCASRTTGSFRSH